MQYSHRTLLMLALPVFLIIAEQVQAQPLDCENWLSKQFFSEATNEDVKRCIEDRKMDWKLADQFKLTPLHYSAGYNADPLVSEELIRQYLAIKFETDASEINSEIDSEASATFTNSKDKNGMTPLHWAAAESNNPGVIDVLRKWGADMNSTSEEYELTPLHLASRFNANISVITELIELDAAATAADINGLTPLHFAAVANKDPEAFRVLIGAGADPNSLSVDNLTPLHIAAGFNQNRFVIRTLIEEGASVNAKDVDGWTPLHWAAAGNENLEVIEELIKATENPNLEDRYGRTPLHISAVRNNTIAFDTLFEVIADGHDSAERFEAQSFSDFYDTIGDESAIAQRYGAQSFSGSFLQN